MKPNLSKEFFMNGKCEKLNALRCKLSPWALLLLRVTAGVVMTVHGWQKFSGGVEGFAGHLTNMGIPFPTISAYLAVAGELLGGLGLIVGLFTPLAAFGVFCTMAVAVFVVHFPNGLLASNNGFEYPLTLMMAAFYFMCNGAGCVSLDAVIKKKCD
jgi:putative oxidoreductase